MSRSRATAIGALAILLWALLALLTVATAPVPPLLLNAMTFTIGGSLGLVWVGLNGSWRDLARVRLHVYLFGTAGLFGYHFLYFSALRLAPPAEASLIAYLWPLLIVVFSGLLPGERLRGLHVAGALTAFAGAAAILWRGGGFGLGPGHVLAFGCALTWSGYSLASRRLESTPTAAVTIYCLGTAVLSAGAHLVLETPAWPDGPGGWLAIVALGLGPVGLAFYVWDIGVKRGHIQLLGVMSYSAPLLSTLALVGARHAEPSARIAVAAGLITAGAALAARAGARSSGPQA